MRKSLLKTFAAGAFLAFTSATASAEVSWDSLVGTYDFSSSMELLDLDYQGLIVGDCEVTITSSHAIFNLAGNPNSNGQGLTLDAETGTLTINSPAFGDPNTSVLAFADAEGNNPYLSESKEDNFLFKWVWQINNDGTISLPDFTIVEVKSFMENNAVVLAKFSGAKLTPNDEVVEPAPSDTAFEGTYTVSGTYYDYTGESVTGSEKSFTLQINNKNQVVQIAGYDLSSLLASNAIVGTVTENTFAFPSDETLWLELGPDYTVLGNGSYSGYETNGIALTYTNGEWNLTDFSVWNYDWSKTGEEAFSRIGFWMGMTIVKTSGDVPVEPEPSATDFTGCYMITSDVYNYETKDYEWDSTCLLAINEENQVVKIAGYDLQSLIDMGYAITGKVEGNEFTFESAWGMYLTAGSTSLMLGNGDYSGVYGDTGIILSEVNDGYNFTSFTVWSVDQSNYPDVVYSPVKAWMNINIEKLSDDPSYVPEDKPGDEPGTDEPGEGLPYLGEYTVKGTKVSYTDGVAGDPEEVTFVMTIVEDEDGDYGITTFAGYDVPEDSLGYPGIYAWEGDEENIVEFFASGNTIINEEGDLIVGGASTSEYEEDFVDIVFTTDDEGTVTDFTVWKAEFDDWGDVVSATLVASWSNLTFSAGATGAVESILDSNAPVEYFNLQGVKVQNPSKGIYIIRQGKTSKKAVIR